MHSKDIPTVDYIDLYNDLAERMRDERYHPAHYFAAQTAEGLRFFLLLLDDRESTVMISSFVPDYYSEEGHAVAHGRSSVVPCLRA